MTTKAELIAAMSELKDTDEVLIALVTPKDDEDEGFAETEGTSAPKADDEDEDPGYIECLINDTEVVDAADGSGAKALLLYVDIPDGDEDDDDIYVDDEGHYVDADDNYVDKEGNPSDTPVKADPEDLEDA